MLGRGLMLAATRALSYRAGATTNGSATITKPPGVTVGDIVIVSAANDAALGNVTTTSGATWSTDVLTWSGTTSRIWWKVLDATDVANAWTGPISGKYLADAWVGYGASTVTVKTASTFSAAQPSLTGYAPSSLSRGTIAILHQAGGATFNSDPSGFTARETTVNVGNNTAVATAYVDDKLTGYTGGSVAWAFASNPNAAGWLLDVT